MEPFKKNPMYLSQSKDSFLKSVRKNLKELSKYHQQTVDLELAISFIKKYFSNGNNFGDFFWGYGIKYISDGAQSFDSYTSTDDGLFFMLFREYENDLILSFFKFNFLKYTMEMPTDELRMKFQSIDKITRTGGDYSTINIHFYAYTAPIIIAIDNTKKINYYIQGLNYYMNNIIVDDNYLPNKEEKKNNFPKEISLVKRISSFIKKSKKRISVSLGEIEIDKPLGQGGNGLVYGAVLSEIDIAIKFLITEDNSKKQKINLDRFIAEYINVMTLENKKYIVKYIDFDILNFSDEDSDYSVPMILMKRYDKSLKKNPAPHSKEEFINFLSFLLKSVDYIHSNGIIHRDLKPENILIAKDRYFLADFGIASYNPDIFKIRAQTQKNERLANRLFSAPEQEKTGITPHVTMDIYAIGQLLQWFAIGEIHRGTKRKQISSVYDDIIGVDNIIDKCLANNPDDRFQSIEEIKQYLKQISKVAETAEVEKEIDPYIYFDLFNDICRRNFPKNEMGIVHSKDQKRINRLFSDFKENLTSFDSHLWWHNGLGNFSISEIINVEGNVWRLYGREYIIEEIWIKYDNSIINDFIIVHYLAQEAFEINGLKKLETVLLNGKYHITFSELGNGYAEIDGEVIDISQEKREVIKRSDKEGYFIIATDFHCILTLANDRNVIQLLSEMQSKQLTIEELIEVGGKMRGNKNKYVKKYL